MLKISAFILILLAVCVCDIIAKCNVCQPGLHVCVGPDKYRECIGSTPVGDVVTCPAGRFCDTSLRCRTLGTAQYPDCKCGYCNLDPANNFACISKTQKAKCSSSNVATNQYESCGPNMYCVHNGANLACSNTVNAVSVYACEDEPLPCIAAGRFPVVGSGCKKYYLCVYANGKFTKYDYECLGATYFNPSTSQCVLENTCLS